MIKEDAEHGPLTSTCVCVCVCVCACGKRGLCSREPTGEGPKEVTLSLWSVEGS